MKKILYLALAMIGCCVAVACSDSGETVEPASSITVNTPTDNIVLPSSKNAQFAIEFETETNWKASTDVEWATVSPQTGKAGSAKIELITKEPNNTGLDRTGTLTITADGASPVSIAFTQTTSEVLMVKQSEFNVSYKGEEIYIEFATNVEGRFKLMVYSDVSNWITAINNEQSTRALVEESFGLRVLPNHTRDDRAAVFQVYVVDADQTDVVLMESEQITVYQEGEPAATSTDFSADKQVRRLQTHTIGNGVPIVLMGDGFVDTEIAEGYYDQVIDKAVENLFTEEPVRSLRDYFDIWAVTAVSTNNAFGEGFSTAFGSVVDTSGGSGIYGDTESVIEYIRTIDELNDISKIEETLSIVLLNTSVYAGTTSIGHRINGDRMSNFAVSYCPVIEDLNSETFREVLCHESLGHGLAKLLDEYSSEYMGSIPFTEVNTYKEFQSYGWAMNIDLSGSEDEAPWSHMLKDPRYQGKDAFGEELGLYEGACMYPSGVWRPTEESMMNNNTHGFNAPSREAIYKRVMSVAYGEGWTYDYEEFVAFDQAHLPQPTGAEKAKVQMKRLPAPHFADKTLWIK